MNMKKHLILILVTLSYSWGIKAQQAPETSKTVFSEQALAQSLFDPDGQEVKAGDILEANKGKKVLLYVWATWCPDCLEGFPQLFELQKNNPDLHVLFFSLDREEQRWIEGIDKFGLKGEHYWFKTAWKNDFTEYIDLNWIPRYLLLDADGKIAKYYSVKADDPELQAAIDILD